MFTHPEVPELDQAQYETGDGPCLESFRTGHVVYVRSTVEPGPYPDFRMVARRNGIYSVLSTPMKTDTHTVGALNLYAEIEGAFGDDDVRFASEFAEHAGYLMLNTQAYWDSRSLADNLAQAMRSRSVIEQAKGIIMGATGCSEDEAFEQLRHQSQHENIKIRELATELVRRSQRSR